MGNESFAHSLIGKRIQIRSLDWQKQLSGELVAVEKFAYIVRQDSGGVVSILKHAVSVISPAQREKTG